MSLALHTFGSSTGRRNYSESETSMEKITIESIPIVVGREEDGRWWADIESMPGVMAYGATRESAIAAVRALACVSPPIASITVRRFPNRS
jgi:hypothetical protein